MGFQVRTDRGAGTQTRRNQQLVPALSILRRWVLVETCPYGKRKERSQEREKNEAGWLGSGVADGIIRFLSSPQTRCRRRFLVAEIGRCGEISTTGPCAPFDRPSLGANTLFSAVVRLRDRLWPCFPTLTVCARLRAMSGMSSGAINQVLQQACEIRNAARRPARLG